MQTPATAKSAGRQTNTNPIYRAVVTLEQQTVRSDSGTPKALRPGLRVQADIVLEKRRLYEWLLQPFARLRDRIGG